MNNEYIKSIELFRTELFFVFQSIAESMIFAWNEHSLFILSFLLVFGPRCPPLSNFWQRRRMRQRGAELARFEPGADGVHPLIWLGSVLIFAAVGTLFTWASVFEIEINAQAEGHVQPTGRVVQIQSSVGGVVGRIHVQNGDRVRPETLLITLNDEDSVAQLASVQAELAARTAEALRHRASLEGDPLSAFDQFIAASAVPKSIAELERAVLAENLGRNDADAELQNGAIRQRQSQIDEERTRITRYESRIRLVLSLIHISEPTRPY